MRTFFILSLSLFSLSAFAQSAAEEAIILNQELQYLEDSIRNVEAVSLNKGIESPTSNSFEGERLERLYFGDNVEDSVNTRTAAPKRRGL